MHIRGRSVRSGSLALRYTPVKPGDVYRVAVVVSKKVSKSAVIRNRIRRRVYEHVRILYVDKPAPFNMVFMVYDEKLAVAPQEFVAQEIHKVIQKAARTST